MKALQAVVFAAALSIGTAQASTIYTYTGNHYTAVTPSGVFDATMSITGSFTLAAPVISEVSFTNVYLTALDFSFSNGHDTLGPADVNPDRTQFQIQTDAVGNITQWLVQLVTPVSVGASAASAFTSNIPNLVTDEGQFLVECTLLASPGLCATSTGFSDATNFEDPGTWTVTTDNGSNTPLPAALPLFATGLGGLGLLGWRRKKKAAV